MQDAGRTARELRVNKPRGASSARWCLRSVDRSTLLTGWSPGLASGFVLGLTVPLPGSGFGHTAELKC